MTDLELRAAAHVDYLSRVIGSRHSGSAGGQAAADYIAGQMRGLGLAVEMQTFPCPAWECDAAELMTAAGALEVLANPYSPACDVTAGLVPVATLAELEAAGMTGRIALLYGDLTRAPLACKSWFLKEERDVRIIELLEQKAPAAVLTVQAQPGSINCLIEDWEFTIPSATVPAESALVLFQNLTAQVHLRLQTRQQPAATANVIGRRPGSRPETIVFCAHYDTKIGTPGALDNAGGVAALLALAGHCASSPPEAGLEFVAFSNEEYLPIGDDAYLAARGEESLNQVLLAVNFDGLGHILDANSLSIYTSSEAFTACVQEIHRAFPGMQWGEPWPESNHSSFAWRGVPALAFTSRAAWHYAHQRADTAQWVSPARLAEAVRLTAQVAQAVQSRPLAWLRPPAEEPVGSI